MKRIDLINFLISRITILLGIIIIMLAISTQAKAVTSALQPKCTTVVYFPDCIFISDDAQRMKCIMIADKIWWKTSREVECQMQKKGKAKPSKKQWEYLRKQDEKLDKKKLGPKT